MAHPKLRLFAHITANLVTTISKTPPTLTFTAPTDSVVDFFDGDTGNKLGTSSLKDAKCVMTPYPLPVNDAMVFRSGLGILDTWAFLPVPVRRAASADGYVETYMAYAGLSDTSEMPLEQLYRLVRLLTRTDEPLLGVGEVLGPIRTREAVIRKSTTNAAPGDRADIFAIGTSTIYGNGTSSPRLGVDSYWYLVLP